MSFADFIPHVKGLCALLLILIFVVVFVFLLDLLLQGDFIPLILSYLLLFLLGAEESYSPVVDYLLLHLYFLLQPFLLFSIFLVACALHGFEVALTGLRSWAFRMRLPHKIYLLYYIATLDKFWYTSSVTNCYYYRYFSFWYSLYF